MNARLSEVAGRLRGRHTRLEGEASSQQARWRYRLRRNRVRFEQQARAAHRRFKQSLFRFLRESSIPNLLTAPIIYSLIVPLAVLDLWLSVYQRVCFPIYGIPRVRRRNYLIIDRHRLGYLNAIEKANCVYCGYATGLTAYLREVTARTEQYWCPIKHARPVRDPHAHYPDFVEYGDAEGYRRRLPSLRKSWTPKTRRKAPPSIRKRR
jgi:hypothetical protein